MNEKFFDLKKEKQDRMINAALKVFAENGYGHASTDEIVAEASISKGLLFHYFGSKLGLYAFLFDYSTRFAILELNSGVAKEECDFYSLQQQLAEAEVSICRQFPYLLLFLESAATERVEEARLAIEPSRHQVPNCYHNLAARADCSSLGKNSDAAKLARMIRYTKLGLLKKHLREETFSPDALYREIADYLALLQRLMLK
ncbi:MAG: helix-turn-helix domain-containing protein [Eubacteriales bacterium]|nr:helix-turn-helix domain-containing protein [Eubacteriales bacterium]